MIEAVDATRGPEIAVAAVMGAVRASVPVPVEDAEQSAGEKLADLVYPVVGGPKRACSPCLGFKAASKRTIPRENTSSPTDC